MTNDEYVIWVGSRLKDVELMLGQNSLNWKRAHIALDTKLTSTIKSLEADRCEGGSSRRAEFLAGMAFGFSLLSFLAFLFN